MEAKSNHEWRKWGEVDPMYGVASWDGKEAGGPDAWDEQEFFELGRADWADLHRRWTGYGLTPGTCVEIGCGTGRMTRAMAEDFDHVHGVDVAPGMLRHAQQAVEGLDVTLHEVDGLTLPLPDSSVDAAFSTHVFQHLDSAADADANWAEIARVLSPGGTAMVHLPVHMWPGGLDPLQGVYGARRVLGDVRARIARRRMRSGGAPIMRGQSYEWSRLEKSLTGLGFVDLELLVIRMSSNGGQHSCVLARRAPG